MYVCMYVYMSLSMYVMFVCMYVSMYVCIYLSTVCMIHKNETLKTQIKLICVYVCMKIKVCM
jgi:hypothetical protein